MSSCIRVLYITVFGLFALAAAAAPQSSDPDALFRDRENIASARAAADIWQSRLDAGHADFESAWKLARACYWLGGHVPQEERRQQLERGVAAGRRARDLEPERPEGYFWMAANMGALAESFGVLQGLRYRGAIREALETVHRIDPAFEQGSADRALGRWYDRVPRLFGGSLDKAEQHLRASLAYHATNHASLFFLAETLIKRDRLAEAAALLTTLVEAPITPDWAPEDREFKQKARTLLASLH